MVDISAGIRSNLEESLKKAKMYYERGDDENAAREYDRSSKLMSELVNDAVSEKVKKMRIEKARKYKEIADGLRSGKTVMVTHEKEEKVKKEDEFKSYALSLIEKFDISWDEIGGLEDIKNTIKESVVLAYAKKPKDVKIEGWRNILLFGSPRTGKTLIAAATSNGLAATFFNVKVGQVLSKYYGESSKILGAIFEVAREKSPAVIFLDEFDSIALSRSAKIDEATRRVLSTLLTELDGLSKSKGSDSENFILFIASTNTPWDIDEAVISRFERRIFVPLPDERAREEILKIHLERNGFDFEDYQWIIERTNGYSGRDIKNLCKDVVNNMVRELNPEIHDLADKGLEEIKKYQIKVRALTKDDFEKGFERVKPATTVDLAKRYDEWSGRFGSG